MAYQSNEIELAGDSRFARKTIAYVIEIQQAVKRAVSIREALIPTITHVLDSLYDADEPDYLIDVDVKSNGSLVISIYLSEVKAANLLEEYSRPELARRSSLFVEKLRQVIVGTDFPITLGSTNAHAVTDFHWDFHVMQSGSVEKTEVDQAAEHILGATIAREFASTYEMVEQEELKNAVEIVTNNINQEALQQEIRRYLGRPDAMVLVRVLPDALSKDGQCILLEVMILGIQDYSFSNDDYEKLLKKMELLVATHTGFPFKVDAARSEPFMPRRHRFGRKKGTFSCGMALVSLVWNQ